MLVSIKKLVMDLRKTAGPFKAAVIGKDLYFVWTPRFEPTKIPYITFDDERLSSLATRARCCVTQVVKYCALHHLHKKGTAA